MLNCSTRTGFYARLTTDYMNTTGSCIGFYYWLTYSDDQPIIAVIVLSEELMETQVWNVTDMIFPGWNRAFVELPAGTNKVIIQGTRAESGYNGLALDDVIVQSC